MKKIYFIVSLLTVFLCTSAVAEVVTTTRKVTPQQEVPAPATIKPVVTSRLAENMRTCTPYTESLDSSYIGLIFNFKIQIKGWVDDKCEVDFTAKSKGIDNLFKSLYGGDSSDTQVFTYEPVAKCTFTKEQLAAVGDSILEEEKRKNGGKMLKDPDDIDLSELNNMSSNDEALMDIVFRQGACSIQNGSSSPMKFNGLQLLGF